MRSCRGAQALLALDRRDEAEGSLRDALGVAERIGYQRALWQAHAGLAEVARRCGQTERAGAHEATARALVEKAAATLADGDLRRVLVATGGR